MKAYWVANYTEIKDDERLKKYAVKAKEAVEKYSGRILARSANNITLDGREMVRVATLTISLPSKVILFALLANILPEYFSTASFALTAYFLSLSSSFISV